MPMWRVFLDSRPSKVPAVPAPSPEEARKRINELSGLAQGALFSLLGAMAVFIVVLLSTRDADFFIESRTTTLPLIGVGVSTERFFIFASITVSFLYFYLHFYCLKLWSQVCGAPAGVLSGEINPSLINDLALALKADATPRGGNDWRFISMLGTGLLIWVAEPAVLGLAWFQSVPDIDGLKLAISVCLFASVAIGMFSFLSALKIQAKVRPPDGDHGERLANTTYAVAALAMLLLIPARPINIERENLVELDGQWALAAERRESFRRQWCKEEGIGFGGEPAGLGVCGNMPGTTPHTMPRVDRQRHFHCSSKEKIRRPSYCAPRFDDLDRRFDTAWMAQRKAELDRLPELDLSERDLGNAHAEGAKFVAARLWKTSLSGADVRHANFEGANLIDASLTNTNANYAGLDRADLTRADLSGEKSNFASATFEGAILLLTNLDGANLKNAHLVAANLLGANLAGTNLQNARLHRANLAGAILDGADLTKATGLTQTQLKFAVGDEKTKLPSSPPALWVWSCWPTLPDEIEGMLRNEELRSKITKRICRLGKEPGKIYSPTPAAMPAQSTKKQDQTGSDLGNCNQEKESLAVALAYAQGPAHPKAKTPGPEMKPPDPEVSLAECRREIGRLRLALDSAQPPAVPAPSPPAISQVLFDLGSADLGSGAERRVGELAASLQGRELARIRVVGHTDRLGPMAFNLRLAEKRARAVASFLEAKGVAPGLIETMPMPEFRAPILTGDGVSEPLNRAVEIIPFGRVPPPPPRPSEPPVTVSARDLPLQ